ncbi:MAG: folate-binding protein [Pseudomonadota bacterium]
MSGYWGLVETRRSVLVMSGTQARQVLQDVVTNNVTGASEDQAVYAAMLTPQGKFLFDFFILGRDDDLLLDIDAARAEILSARLRMYCLRRDAAISKDDALEVTLAWSDQSGAHPPSVPAGTQVVPDPREPGLGWRIYGATGPGIQAAGRREYDRHRIALSVPEAGPDLRENETYILEAGFERLNGVDFKKGCYVGQEVTARMKHKAQLRKGLVRVEVDGEAEPGIDILADGKIAGVLLSNVDGVGLAHLRFDRAKDEMQAGETVVRYTA